MKIEYKLDPITKKLFTKCPHDRRIAQINGFRIVPKVGSKYCQKCKDFIRDDEEGCFIECKRGEK